MKRTIFYSWQSDLSNSTNRGFIEECIEKAIKEIKNRLDIDFSTAKLLQKSEMRKDIVIELSYKGFG